MYLPNRNVPDRESKVNMFADDTQLITKTEEFIEETFKTLGILVYEKASSAKINLEKKQWGCIQGNGVIKTRDLKILSDRKSRLKL